MRPDDRIRIAHMIDMAETAQCMVAGRARHDLDTDVILKLALTRAIEVIGEAAARTSAAAKEAAPDISWPSIVGARNRLVHAYFDIDSDILWKTATEAIPALLPALRALYARG